MIFGFGFLVIVRGLVEWTVAPDFLNSFLSGRKKTVEIGCSNFTISFL